MVLKNIIVRNDFEKEIKRKNNSIRVLLILVLFLATLLISSSYNYNIEKNTVYKTFRIFMPKNDITLENCKLREFSPERTMWCDSGTINQYPQIISLK